MWKKNDEKPSVRESWQRVLSKAELYGVLVLRDSESITCEREKTNKSIELNDVISYNRIIILRYDFLPERKMQRINNRSIKRRYVICRT